MPCAYLRCLLRYSNMTGKWLDGKYKPSSEVPMHLAVMNARPDVKATVHTHAMFATIMAMGKDAELRPITPPQCEFTPVGIPTWPVSPPT